MWSFLNEDFESEYLSKENTEERLSMLHNKRKDAIKENNMEKLIMISGLMEIVNAKYEEAMEYFKSPLLDSNDSIVKLAKCEAKLNKAEKEEKYKQYCEVVQEIDNVVGHSHFNSLFMKLALGHAYYVLGENFHKQRKKNYIKAFEIIDKVIKEHKDDQNKEKLIRFYNDKGNLYLQLADFDKENQILIYDDNFEPKLYNQYEDQASSHEFLKRDQCLEEARKCFEKAIELNYKYANAHNGLGSYYREKNKIDEAIKCYNTAINLDNNFFYPQSYIGDCYRLKEMYDEAEKSFNRAIQINGNHVFCMYGLGKVYYELGNRRENGLEYFKKAKIYFDKAIKRDKSFPYAKFDLGRTLAKLESDRVPKLELDCMLQGMESDNSKAELKSQIEGYYSNLESYFEVIRKTYEEAMELFRQKYPCENDKYEHWKDNITFCIKNLENTMKHYEKLKDIGIGIANNEKDIEGVFKKVLFYTISTGVEERTVSNEKKFNTTFLSNKFPTQINDEDEFILHTLRRWNSFTPIIADNSKGGGYYIEYKGNGIVIDPGHNFIDNFKQAGFKFANINSILITHAHDDHTADLESIINLLYRYNKQLEESIIPREVARENWVAANNVNDILRDENNPRHYEYKEIVNERYSEQKKKIDIYMSEEAFIKYSGIFKYDKKCRILTTADEIKDAEVKEMIIEINQYKDKEENRNEKEEMYFVNVIHADKEREFGKIRIRAIKSSHRDLFEKKSSLGFVFEFEKTALVYTGDTGWRDIEESYQDIKYKLGDKKIILLAHIGGFKLEEIEALDEAPNINCHYKNHLGRLGLVQINKILQPQICLISEFGEEFKYNRVKVAKIFNAAFKDFSKHTNFIPADIGLSVDLQKALIKAYIEIDTDNRKIIWDMVDPNEISVGEYKKGNSLFYYINNNKLTENECLQALMQDFKICRVEKK